MGLCPLPRTMWGVCTPRLEPPLVKGGGRTQRGGGMPELGDENKHTHLDP